jgi:hypothetical protein
VNSRRGSLEGGYGCGLGTPRMGKGATFVRAELAKEAGMRLSEAM